MEYAVLGAAVAFVAVKFWLDERKEKRWFGLLNDLLNRKMARDFYDYVNGTEIINKSKNPQAQLFENITREIEDRKEVGKVPSFINQKRPGVDLRVGREY